MDPVRQRWTRASLYIALVLVGITSAGATQYITHGPGKHIRGDEIGEFGGLGPDECRRACSKNPSCLGYETYQHEGEWNCKTYRAIASISDSKLASKQSFVKNDWNHCAGCCRTDRRGPEGRGEYRVYAGLSLAGCKQTAMREGLAVVEFNAAVLPTRCEVHHGRFKQCHMNPIARNAVPKADATPPTPGAVCHALKSR